ncbi:signal peptidase I [Enterococcus sp. LJL120]
MTTQRQKPEKSLKRTKKRPSKRTSNSILSSGLDKKKPKKSKRRQHDTQLSRLAEKNQTKKKSSGKIGNISKVTSKKRKVKIKKARNRKQKLYFLKRLFKKKKSKKYLLELRDFSLVLVVMIFGGVGLSFIFFSISNVNGYSMASTLRDNDVVIVKKTQNIERLDLLVFERRNSQEIRRVIGLPGDRIEYIDDVLYVNGEIINEHYIIDLINEAQRTGYNYTENFKMQTITGEAFVPENCYFVLGDNREWAIDSREYGFVEKDQVVGVVKMRLLPVNDFTLFMINFNSMCK